MSTPYILGDLPRGTVISAADYYDEYGDPTRSESAFPVNLRTRRQGTLRIRVSCESAVGVGVLDAASGQVDWLDDGDALIAKGQRQWDLAVKGDYEFNVVFTDATVVRILYVDCVER